MFPLLYMHYFFTWEHIRKTFSKGGRFWEVKNNDRVLCFVFFVVVLFSLLEIQRSHFKMVLMKEIIRKIFGENKIWLWNRLFVWNSVVFEFYFMVTLDRSLHLLMPHSHLWKVDKNIPYISKYLEVFIITRVKRKQNCLYYRYFCKHKEFIIVGIFHKATFISVYFL